MNINFSIYNDGKLFVSYTALQNCGRQTSLLWNKVGAKMHMYNVHGASQLNQLVHSALKRQNKLERRKIDVLNLALINM